MGGLHLLIPVIAPVKHGYPCISLSISYFSRKSTYLSILYITVHKSYFYRNKKLKIN